MKKILVLTANPKDTTRLRIDEEVREIEEGLRRSKDRDQFLIQSKWAVRIRDLRRAIMDEEPNIVHFCGHGKEEGLIIEDDDGKTIIVNPEALAGLFKHFQNQVECVLLNACYSQRQAEAINEYIDFVIGMNKGIQDQAAIEFVVGFYDALGVGRSFEEAFEFGCNAIQLYNIPQHLIPHLLKKSSSIPKQVTSSTLIYTEDKLADLENELIPLPLLPPIKIVDSLKQLPRSGKKIRLETFEPKIPIRSIYDHILSLAHLADCLLPVINHNIRDQEIMEVARCIVYHEINEILLGDIPSYTNLTDRKREQARIFAERRLHEIPLRERERISNEFIAMFLGERERASLRAFNDLIEEEDNPVTKFFRVLDTIDPIIATWRYLYHFRGKLGNNIDLFLRRMKDFFENPRVKKEAARYTEDKRISDLIYQLQDRTRAKQYYLNPNMIREFEASFSLPVQLVSNLIEGRSFHFTEQKNPEFKEL